jgi:hypothetical protein
MHGALTAFAVMDKGLPYFLLQCPSKSCQCAYHPWPDPAGYRPHFEAIAERDLLAPNMQASSHFGLCKFTSSIDLMKIFVEICL